MAVIPTTFPPVQEPAIATFNFTDIANGTGVLVLQGADTAQGKILVGNQVYSSDIETSAASVGAPFAKVIDVDFDLTAFNLPRTLKGTAVINVPFAVQSEANSTTHNAFVIVNIKHVDSGSTETSLGTAQSDTITSPSSAGGITQKVAAVTIALTERHFKKGETLRITVEGWVNVAGLSGITIGHDPQNRDGARLTPSTEEVTTQMIANIPIRIDL